MLSNAYIRTIFRDMQQRNGIKKQHNGIKRALYSDYTIHIKNNDTIEICGYLERLFTVQTTQLSDIHAILQLCHPNEPYYIHYDIKLSKNCPRIPVYSYSDAPNIITGRNPINKNNRHYIIDLHSLNIHITPNEPFSSAIQRVTDATRDILLFVEQYPNIAFRYTQLQTYEFIPSYPDILMYSTTHRISSNDIEVRIGMGYNADLLHVAVFTITAQHNRDIYTQYHAHIADSLPAFFLAIQQHISNSQHEKIHINRAINQYLTKPDGGIFSQVQDCINILRDHYIYVPKDPTL